MPETTSYAPGSSCRLELVTTGPEASKSFDISLFGWTHRDLPLDGPSFCSIFRHRGRDLAGVYGLPDEMRSDGVPTPGAAT
jgi:predicted enzyme related to lactoylglutathione lyase